jgi:hypothetical protein
MSEADAAIRNYLLAVRDPDTLKDTETARQRRAQLLTTEDPVERLRLQQDIIEAEHVDPARFEAAFVEHARTWADNRGVTHAAFQAEGVGESVLRRAGFALRSRSDRGPGRAKGSRTRVSADAIRAAIPSGTFTVKDVQEASGASAAVVRRVIHEEVAAGNVTTKGTDPHPAGPGRSPTLYHKS